MESISVEVQLFNNVSVVDRFRVTTGGDWNLFLLHVKNALFPQLPIDRRSCIRDKNGAIIFEKCVLCDRERLYFCPFGEALQVQQYQVPQGLQAPQGSFRLQTITPLNTFTLSASSFGQGFTYNNNTTTNTTNNNNVKSLEDFGLEKEEEKDKGELPDYIKAHPHSINNAEEIKDSTNVGCFQCKTIFSPNDLQNKLEQIPNEGTVLCPFCKTDALIGDASDFQINGELMQKMHEHWFEKGI